MMTTLERTTALIPFARRYSRWLPESTRSAVEQLVHGLKSEEREVAFAKACELVRDGYSVERTSRERFAANMALELSEYVATGARASSALLDRMLALRKQAGPIFDLKPELDRTLLGNLVRGAKNLTGLSAE